MFQQGRRYPKPTGDTGQAGIIVGLSRVESRPRFPFHWVVDMKPLSKRFLHGSGVALLATAAMALAHAQSGQKTIGGKPAAGKMMTKDELRTCFARRDEMNAAVKPIDAERDKLAAERAEILKEGDVLKLEREEVDKRLAVVREWEGRVKAHGQAIEEHNKKMAEHDAAGKKELPEELKSNREQIEKTTAQLRSEESTLVPAYQSSVKTYNERATARDAKVTSWNERNAASLKVAEKHEETRKAWSNECANRPYREDDEIALKRGK
jgi:chromosome segregation ATPase